MLADAFLDGVRRHDAEYQRFNVAAAVLKEAAATCSAQMKATGEATDRDFAWFSQDAMEAAVGKEGQDGDPKAIAELAAQWVKLYEDMMAFAVQLSDRDAPPPVRLLYLTEALMMARPLREIREFRGAVRQRGAQRGSRGSRWPRAKSHLCAADADHGSRGEQGPW